MTTIVEVLRGYYRGLTRLMEADGLSERRACEAISQEVARHERAFSAALYPQLNGTASRSIALAPVYTRWIEDAAARGEMIEVKGAINRYLQRVHSPIVIAAKMQCGWDRACRLAEEVLSLLTKPDT